MHLIPPNPNGYSNTYGVNLVWQENNVYIMDNHRVAAWCWGQHVPVGELFSIFHIDRHYDLLQSALEEWLAHAPKIESLDLPGYLDVKIDSRSCGPYPIFRWDNYLPIFLRQRPETLREAYFMTHEEGDKPWFDHRRILATEHPENLDYWLSLEPRWIFNLDLDFFFSGSPEKTYRLFADAHIRELAVEWRKAHDLGRLYCTTIAMSPEMCGGWDEAISALRIFCEAAKINYPATL